MRVLLVFLVSTKSKMFDFLTDEVFQIVVITALFTIGVVLFMLYRRPSNNNEKVFQLLDDIDYRLDKINKKINDLTNTFVNGLIIDDEGDEEEGEEGGEEEGEEGGEERGEERGEEWGEGEKEVPILSSTVKETESSSNNNEKDQALNYDGIEFSDIPNFSTDTSVLEDENNDLQHNLVNDEVLNETDGGKKHVNIVKRIIQPEE